MTFADLGNIRNNFLEGLGGDCGGQPVNQLAVELHLADGVGELSEEG